MHEFPKLGTVGSNPARVIDTSVKAEIGQIIHWTDRDTYFVIDQIVSQSEMEITGIFTPEKYRVQLINGKFWMPFCLANHVYVAKTLLSQ
jgi:hypothetical protein